MGYSKGKFKTEATKHVLDELHSYTIKLEAGIHEV
jgi:hypothetical protein